MPPTLNTYERRIAIDTDGTVWFGEFQKGKIGRFDPKTEKFQEYDVPGGVDSFPYAIGIGADHSVWYSSYYLDVIGGSIPSPGKFWNIPSRIPKTRSANSFQIPREGCGTARHRTTK